jgi:hypothetical protein
MVGSTRVAPQNTRPERTSAALPATLARPAQRALANAGYTQLDQVTAVSEAELARLHGIGPKALAQLRQALADQGLAFAAAPSQDD